MLTAPAGRITSLTLSTILSLISIPAFIIPPNTARAAAEIIKSLRFGLNLTLFSGIAYLIPDFGQTERHFKHFIQVSLSTVFSFEFIHPEGQLCSHVPQEIQISSIWILHSETFEISPKTVPTGQKSVQKILSFKITAKTAIPKTASPETVKLIADPNTE